MNKKLIQEGATGKYLLADMISIIAGNRSIIDGDYENEVVFYTEIGDTFLYGIQKADSCVLSALTDDAKLVYMTLVQLGITEFESEVEVNDPAFSWENMLHVSFEL